MREDPQAQLGRIQNVVNAWGNEDDESQTDASDFITSIEDIMASSPAYQDKLAETSSILKDAITIITDILERNDAGKLFISDVMLINDTLIRERKLNGSRALPSDDDDTIGL